MTNEVFISYSSEDADLANLACAILEKNGIRCWIAPRSITPGLEWMAAIIEGISECKVMVLIFSAHADRSVHVRREVEHAISKQLVILPFRVEKIEPTGALLYAFSGTQRLDGFHPPIESRLGELVDAVLRLLQKERTSVANVGHTPPINSQANRTPVPVKIGREKLKRNYFRRLLPIIIGLVLLLAVFKVAFPLKVDDDRQLSKDFTEAEGNARIRVARVDDDRQLSKDFTSKSTGMKLTLIPAGEFQMGTASEDHRTPDEGPQHSVKISQSFYMGVYEVTQGEYESVMGTNPSSFSKTGNGSKNVSGQDTGKFPVEQVSWFDVIEFCNKLSLKDGLTPYYLLTDVQRESGSIKSATVEVNQTASAPRLLGYRLPTEAEWEYACRAGTRTPFHFGSRLNGDKANVDGNHPYSTPTKGEFLKRPTRVGSYSKNEFGLFDMHGNVREWCFDVFDSQAYDKRSDTTPDPMVTSGSKYRVVRGGSWFDSPRHSRSADRNWFEPIDRLDTLGFRLARAR